MRFEEKVFHTFVTGALLDNCSVLLLLQTLKTCVPVRRISRCFECYNCGNIYIIRNTLRRHKRYKKIHYNISAGALSVGCSVPVLDEEILQNW